jgi:ABC-type Fe3+/spermidine/putrescine transport system ATPase subunit
MDQFISASRAFFEINDLSYFYGDKAALRNVSLSVKTSEVLALLGPSGSGKSTLLASIAGMITPTRGEIYLDSGRNLLGFPTELRGLGMVFQDFALWPHMTVAQNVGFPLRVRKLAQTEIAKRTQRALERVGLAGFAARRPHELSGGQQQRVALARAVVAETRLLLLDEPLSALDPETRSSVRRELADILRTLDVTTILVTHDREEAFELADRIAVLVDGEIQQHATSEEIYERPATLTVARFMGVNVLSVETNGSGMANLSGGSAESLELPRALPEGSRYVAIVPERVRLSSAHATGENVFAGHLVRSQYCGGEYRLRIRIGHRENGQTVELLSKQLPPNEKVHVQIPVDSLHIVEDAPKTDTKTTAPQPITNAELIKFQERIA